MKKTILSLAVALGCLSAGAHTVAFDENFAVGNDWSGKFTMLNLDHQAVAQSIMSIFMDSNGVSHPWWIAMDSRTTSDRYLISTSQFLYEGTAAADRWLITAPIEIPTEGFNLTFGAQSCLNRDMEHVEVRLGVLHVAVQT